MKRNTMLESLNEKKHNVRKSQEKKIHISSFCGILHKFRTNPLYEKKYLKNLRQKRGNWFRVN